MVETFILTICAFISNLLHAVWRTLVSDWPAGLAREERGLSLRQLMEELSPRQLAVKQLKQQFLEALQADNAQEVLQILHTGKLDVDTVLEVDDPGMVLASYKQGKEEHSDPHFNSSNTMNYCIIMKHWGSERWVQREREIYFHKAFINTEQKEQLSVNTPWKSLSED